MIKHLYESVIDPFAKEFLDNMKVLDKNDYIDSSEGEWRGKVEYTWDLNFHFITWINIDLFEADTKKYDIEDMEVYKDGDAMLEILDYGMMDKFDSDLSEIRDGFDLKEKMIIDNIEQKGDKVYFKGFYEIIS